MPSSSNKISHYKHGIWAEYYAAAFLMMKGYRIMRSRYKTKVGEVDLIAKRGKTLAFIEVKYRQNQTQAIYAVLPKAQSRIRRSAEQYLSSLPAKESLNMSQEIRFDVIGITPKLTIRHIENAF